MSIQVKSPLLDAYLAHRESLLRLLTARTASREDAEDLIQELFFRIRQERPDLSIESPTAYLHRTALNLAHDRRRSRQRSQIRDGRWIEATNIVFGAEAIIDEPEPEGAIDAKVKLAKFVRAIEDLPARCRTVFWLHKIDGLSHAEVAQTLGLSKSTVEKHMSAALRRLVRKLNG